MGDLAHAVLAIVTAFVMFFPIAMGLAFLKAAIARVYRSTEPLEWILGGLVLLLNVGFPFALSVGPMIYMWEAHPLSSIAYAVTLIGLFSYQRYGSPIVRDRNARVESHDSTRPRGGNPQNDIKRNMQEAGRCPHCGGPCSGGVCWSCRRPS